MSIRLKLLLLIIALFVAALSNTAFVYQIEKYGEEKLDWVNHTHEVLHMSQELLGSLTDAETGQRGYLLTEDLSYLEPYLRGVSQATDRIASLHLLILDNSAQTGRLLSVEANMQLKFNELAETIRLVQSGDRSEALALVSQDRGKVFMDDIRVEISSFISAELILLEVRNGDFRSNRAQLNTIIVIELIFFVALLVSTISFLQQSFFRPLRLLQSGAQRVEEGRRIEIADVIEKGEMGRLLATFFSMSEKVYQKVKILDHVAHHDELTGLKNRTPLPADMKDSIRKLKDTGGKLAVLFIDLNGLKKINDSLGHDIGDLVLKKTADRLNESMRDSDSIYRIGGDEYVALINNVDSTSDIHHIVENILKPFENPAVFDGEQIDISLSIGVAVAPDDSSNSTELFKFSDVAMYEAKQDKQAQYKMFNKAMLADDKSANRTSIS